MPSDKNNIYLDSTFTSADVGYTAVDSSVEFVSKDNIGNYNVPTVYKTIASSIAGVDLDVEYFANNITIGVTDNILVSFFGGQVYNFGVVHSLVDYSVAILVSGTCDNPIIYFTGYNTVSGTVDEKVTYIAGEYYTNFKSYLVEYDCDSLISGSNYYWQTYMNFSGHVDHEGLPIPALVVQESIVTEYDTGIKNTGWLSSDIDISFAGWVDFPFLTDVFSVDMGISGTCLFDVQTISGSVTPVYFDVYSSQLTVSGIKNDIYCSLLDMAVLSVEVETTKGRVSYLTQEVYSTARGIPGLICDIGLYPLKITNFSLDIDGYTMASNYISVDILDDKYGVSISGTYLKVEDQTVPVTFSGINDGYRMFYDPINDFNTLNGPTVFIVHAENENGDTLEEWFYLTFGYIVEYDNKPRIDIGFDYNTKVTVRVTAENYASCPKTTADGHRFITEHRENVDLCASIVGMFHADDVSNLSAEIYPQSTAYFYGKTFEIEINAKDFANNVMEPVILRYKIEDRPVL